MPLHAVGRLVALLGDQEQCVVDADAQADHGGQGRPDRGDGHHVAEQADEAEPDGQADHRGDDGHAHRHQAAEGERQDQHGGEQADDLAALGRRLGQDAAEVAADAHADACLARGLGGVEDAVGDLLGDVAVGDVQQDRREGGRRVLAHQSRGGVGERVRRRGDVRRLGRRLVRGLDRLLVGRVGDLALGDVEDDRAAAVLLWWEAAGQQVGRLLALGPGQAQVVARLGPTPQITSRTRTTTPSQTATTTTARLAHRRPSRYRTPAMRTTFPPTGPEDTPRSGHQRKRNIVRHARQRDRRYRAVRRRRVLILGWR
jgi:hypothetical protein